MSLQAVGGSDGKPRITVERRALRDGVYDVLLELLLANGVAPGASLSIEGLARDLGVSPTPVREALGQLEHTGLVTRAPLAELETAHNQHALAARRVERMTARHPEKMDWSTMRRYFNVDWEFHLVLLRNCGNRYLLEMAEDLAPHIHRLRQSMTYGTNDVEQAHTEHEAILEAVRAADPDLATEAMAVHLEAVRERAWAEG